MFKMSRFILWGLVVIWLGVIFYFSSQTGLESAALSNDVAKKISVGAIKVKSVAVVKRTNLVVKSGEVAQKSASVIKREQRIAKRRLANQTRDAAHCVLYFVLGFLFFIALKNHGICFWKVFLWTILFCVVVSIGDELHQNFVPGRGAEVNDVLRDLIGSICGALLGLLFFWFRGRRKASRINT